MTRSALLQTSRGAGQDFRARFDVFAVGDGTAGAGLGFDQHAMPGFAQRGYAARNQPDARFVIFDFFGDADDHLGGSRREERLASWACGAASDFAVRRLGPRPSAMRESELILPSGIRFWSA